MMTKETIMPIEADSVNVRMSVSVVQVRREIKFPPVDHYRTAELHLTR